MSEAITAWKQLLVRTLHARPSVEDFSKDVNQFCSKYTLPSIVLCDLLLRPKNDTPTAPSMTIRTPDYFVALLKMDKIDTCDALRVLRQYSKWNIPSSGQNVDGNTSPEGRWRWSFVQEQAIFDAIAYNISVGDHPRDMKEVGGLIKACSEWATMLSNISLDTGPDLADVHIDGQTNSDLLEKRGMQLATVRSSFRTVIEVMARSKIVTDTLSKCAKNVLQEFYQALGSFTEIIFNTPQGMGQQIDAFRSHLLAPLLPSGTESATSLGGMNEPVDATATNSMSTLSVVDLPPIHSRASLSIYLNSLLVGRSIVDDNTVITYLHNRYRGDVQSSMTALITAAFDVLASACFRRESQATTILLRSFLINKIPLLLVILSNTTIPPTSVEYSMAQAMSSLDINIFPTLSSMFDDASSGHEYTESARQDLCFACCLHGLIEENSIGKLLGETPMQTLPAGGQYLKDNLVNECLNDPGRTEKLLKEVELMNGNAGAVCIALVEVIQQLCASRDTMALKSLCSYLARHPSSLDIVLLFDKVITILKPLCELLDGWHHDEDLGEYQPVYEEFGSILLLVAAFVYRYKLSIADLGIQQPNSFVARWIEQGSSATLNADLSSTENEYLSIWVKALFNAEGGGLSDQPMSSCTPQEFYLLVPTLFSNIVLASTANVLTDEVMKSGIEFLLDTFLSPSLVGAILWLSSHLWKAQATKADRNTIMTILHTLILPNQISGESAAMLSSVLKIVAKPVDRSLRNLQRIEPERQDIAPLQTALADHSDFSRTGESIHTELEGWTSTAGGGLAVAIQQAIQHLVQWSMGNGMNTPSSYNHRQILLGIKLLGASRLLDVLIAAVVQHTQNDMGSVVLDVVVSIICCPDSTSSSSAQPPAASGTPFVRLTLQDALRSRVIEDAKKDAATTAATVRLQRLVEAQTASAQLLQNDAAMLGDMSGNAILAAMSGQNTRMNSLHDMNVLNGLEGMNALSGMDGLGGLGDMTGMNSMLGMNNDDNMSGLATGGMDSMGDADMLGGGASFDHSEVIDSNMAF